MPNIFSYSEDSLPRHFPRSKKQLEQIPAVVPKLTLPTVSLICTENKNIPKAGIKKSFQKWKAQHEAIFTNNSTEPQIKSEKKQVRFDTDGLYYSKRQSFPNQQTHHRVSPSLELSYYESPSCQRNNDCYSKKQQQSYQSYNGCNSRKNSNTANSSQFINGSLESRNSMNLHSYDRVQRSESMKDNSPSSFCCRMNGKCCQTSNNKATDAQGHPQGERWKQTSKELEPLPLRSDGIFLKIMEEQQHHILFQQNQILMHEKNNLEQQKQICMLQLRIQQLLLRNESNEVKSSTKERETISDKMYLEDMFNVLHTKNFATKQMDCQSQVASSNNVMCSFLNDLNDIRKFNETNLTNYGKENLLPNIEGVEDYSRDDFFPSGTNDTIKSSSAMNDRRINGRGHATSSHSDINITAQTLIYEALSTNDSLINSQKATDRSFALHMLGMKYQCEQDNGYTKANTDERVLYYNQSNLQSNDQLYEKNPSDTYEYLIRHGLMKR